MGLAKCHHFWCLQAECQHCCDEDVGVWYNEAPKQEPELIHVLCLLSPAPHLVRLLLNLARTMDSKSRGLQIQESIVAICLYPFQASMTSPFAALHVANAAHKHHSTLYSTSDSTSSRMAWQAASEEQKMNQLMDLH